MDLGTRTILSGAAPDFPASSSSERLKALATAFCVGTSPLRMFTHFQLHNSDNFHSCFDGIGFGGIWRSHSGSGCSSWFRPSWTEHLGGTMLSWSF
jgi:hypothetical protein